MSIEYYKENRLRLKENLQKKGIDTKGAIILLKGSFLYPENDSDTYYTREKYEENIQYLFGIKYEEVDALINLDDEKTFFLTDDLDPNSFFYSKHLKKEEAKKIYGVDDVLLNKDLLKYLETLKPSKILIYKGLDVASKNWSNFYNNEKILSKFWDKIDEDTLFPILNSQRNLKSKKEIDLFLKTCEISSRAHIKCMQNCLPGMFEYQISALFEQSFGAEGAEDHAYNPICAGNKNGAYLHYMVNEDLLKNGQLLLTDMGCKQNGVCSDITCTYPVNGVFTQRQKSLYNVVLKAQRNAIEQLKPGVKYGDLQDEAFVIILEGLLDLGILKGSVKDLLENEIHKIFMPHHLGHFIGYRTHDVGPQKKNGKDKEESKQYDVIWDCVLQEGMALTVEPGIYFIDVLIENSKKNPIKVFFDYEVIEDYRLEIGGIRIEDDLVVTKDGALNGTVCPRTVDEIEKCMAGQDWQ